MCFLPAFACVCVCAHGGGGALFYSALLFECGSTCACMTMLTPSTPLSSCPFIFFFSCSSVFLCSCRLPNLTILYYICYGFAAKKILFLWFFSFFFSLSLFDMNRGHLVSMYFIIWDLSNIYDVMRWVCGITKQICSATHTHCECILQLNIFLLLDDGYADARWDGKRAMFAG